MNNLLVRSLTGLAFVVLMTFGLLFNLWTFLVLLILIALGCLWEYYSLMEKADKGVQKIPGMILALVVLGAAAGKYFLHVNPIPLTNILSLCFLIYPIYMIIRLFTTGKAADPFSPTLSGIVYTVFPFALLILHYSYLAHWREGNNAQLLFAFIALIWVNDTFAYLCGMAVGKHKLFERISPKKTWEGFIGGVLFTLAGGWAAWKWTGQLELHDWFVIALITSVIGTLGDLVESQMKRELAIKDSGGLLPGHGGLLDRFDAVLIAAPFVTAYHTLIS